MSIRRRPILFGLLLVAVAGVAEAAELRADLALHATLPEPVTVAFEVTADGNVVRRGEATAPGPLALTDLPAPPWTLVVSAPGWWSAPLVIRGEARSPETVHLWSAAKLEAVIRVPLGVERPTSISLRIDFGDSESRGRRKGSAASGMVTVICPIDEEGRISCQVPRTRGLDLRLRTPGFASRFFWDVDLEKSAVFDAGTIELRPGASVIGRVEVPPGYELLATRVELAPAAQSPYPRPEGERVTRGRAVTDVPDVRGMVAFEGLRAGTYTLRATHPDLAEVVLSPIAVVEGAQSGIDEPIVLAPPTSLELAIDPPVDAYDGEWRVELVKTGSALLRSAPVASGFASAGYFEAPAVAPGTYEVRVADSRGVRLAKVELTATGAKEIHPIVVNVVRVEGSVRLAEEPLVARLTFRDSTTVEMESDAEGNFTGYLPHGGSWDVEVSAHVPPLRWRERTVEVEVEDGRAVLDLVFPDTRLGGVVVDEAGEAQHRATVTVEDPSGAGISVDIETDAAGEFRFHGLSEGRHSVRAGSTGNRRSAVHEVDLREGAEPRLTLVLRSSRLLRGRVVDPSGTPLPDVWVEVSGYTASGYIDLGEGGTATTNLGGSFEFALAESSAITHLVILAPGYALRQLTTAVGDVGDLVVTSEGGTLVAEVPPDIPWRDPRRPRPTLIDGGGRKIYLGFFAQWARLHGTVIGPETTRFVIPALSPGTYALCWASTEELMQLGAPVRDCDHGELTAGGTLQLRLGPLSGAAADAR